MRTGIDSLAVGRVLRSVLLPSRSCRFSIPIPSPSPPCPSHYAPEGRGYGNGNEDVRRRMNEGNNRRTETNRRDRNVHER